MSGYKIGVITCWYKDKSCARYAYGLIDALKEMEVDTEIFSANCLCYRDDPFNEQLFISSCHKLEFSDFYWKPGTRMVQYLRAAGEVLTDGLKGYKYLKHLKGFSLVHYQQVGGSYGFLPLLSFLSVPADCKRIVTVHELDKMQIGMKVRSAEFPTGLGNKIYNRADAVVVMTQNMKNALINMGVHKDKLHVIPHGATLSPIRTGKNRLIVFCGGHHLTAGKGFDKFLEALLLLKQEGRVPPVLIYGLNLEYGQQEGKGWVEKADMSRQVEWFDYENDEALTARFQEAMFMVIPYTASEVGAPATTAMANGVPVIASRNSGLPEYLGEDGIYVNGDDSKELAACMVRLMDDDGLREQLGKNLYKKASENYRWSVIGRRTVELYEKVLRGSHQFQSVNLP